MPGSFTLLLMLTVLAQNPAPAPPSQPLVPLQQTPPRVAPQGAQSCVKYTMKLIPVAPNVDPKFVKPIPESAFRNNPMPRFVPPVQPQCR